jgi:nucleotide-binding universal stress UspA family protein
MRMLIAYDGSDSSEAAMNDLSFAGLSSTTKVMVLSIAGTDIPPLGSGIAETRIPPDSLGDIATARRLADEGRRRLQLSFPDWEIRSESAPGSPAEMILEKAKEWSADLIVVGTHERSRISRLVLGSVSMKVVNEASCSVRVARPARAEESLPLRIVVGNDGSSEAQAVVTELTKRRWPPGTEARILSVVEPIRPTHVEEFVAGTQAIHEADEEHRAWLQGASNECISKLQHVGVAASSSMKEGSPAAVLIHEAETWKAHSIFVGSRGMGRMERLLLGSVSSTVVSVAPCSVEVVHPKRRLDSALSFD